ncbi:MAG: DUF86 domain-containing protein [Bacteroidales bacterium]|nr:DUF86 domain-containing protein [Bacteroidales bacterium]
MPFTFRERILDMLDFVKNQASFIEKTTAQVKSADDFMLDPAGVVLYNSTCMCLQTIGETLKKVDALTKQNFLMPFYPQVPWRGVFGLRNIIAHEYENTEPEEIYHIIKSELPELYRSVLKIIDDITNGVHDAFWTSIGERS